MLGEKYTLDIRPTFIEELDRAVAQAWQGLSPDRCGTVPSGAATVRRRRVPATHQLPATLRRGRGSVRHSRSFAGSDMSRRMRGIYPKPTPPRFCQQVETASVLVTPPWAAPRRAHGRP